MFKFEENQSIMKNIGFILAGLLLSISCSEAQPGNSVAENSEPVAVQQDETINRVLSASEFKEKLSMEDRQLIDVRTDGEYSAGKIADAENIDFYAEDFKDQMAKLDKDKPVMLYCHSGGRSGKAARMLKDMGFKEVYDLKGGYSRWPDK